MRFQVPIFQVNLMSIVYYYNHIDNKFTSHIQVKFKVNFIDYCLIS